MEQLVNYGRCSCRSGRTAMFNFQRRIIDGCGLSSCNFIRFHKTLHFHTCQFYIVHFCFVVELSCHSFRYAFQLRSVLGRLRSIARRIGHVDTFRMKNTKKFLEKFSDPGRSQADRNQHQHYQKQSLDLHLVCNSSFGLPQHTVD